MEHLSSDHYHEASIELTHIMQDYADVLQDDHHLYDAIEHLHGLCEQASFGDSDAMNEFNHESDHVLSHLLEVAELEAEEEQHMDDESPVLVESSNGRSIKFFALKESLMMFRDRFS